MSTPATDAADAAALAAAAAAKKPITTVPADIRRRVLGTRPPSPTDTAGLTAEQIAEKEKAEKAKVDADKAEADRKKAETAAAANGTAKPRVHKAKDGPALPDKPAAGDNRSVEQIVREVLPGIVKEAKPAPAPAATPEIDREIELAQFAATKNPERYAGFADKVKGFYASRDELLAAKAKELGGQTSAEFKDYLEGDEFKGWVDQNRPSYARGDKAKLAEDMIADRARREVTLEMQPKLKEMERKTSELEHGPVITAKTNAALRVIITDTSDEKDPALEGFAKDPLKFGEEHPEEARVIATEAAEAVALIQEVYRIDLDLVDFNPKARPQQQTIREFMVRQNAEMRNLHPNGVEMKDGKILIDAQTFKDRQLDKDARYRTFNADEMAGMIAATSNAKVKEKLQQRRVGVTKSIYAPKPAETAAGPSGQAGTGAADPPSPGAVTSSARGSPAKTGTGVSLARKYA